jgi:hypothetical protein
MTASQKANIHSGIVEARKKKNVFLNASQNDFEIKISLKFWYHGFPTRKSNWGWVLPACFR